MDQRIPIEKLRHQRDLVAEIATRLSGGLGGTVSVEALWAAIAVAVVDHLGAILEAVTPPPVVNEEMVPLSDFIKQTEGR